MIGQYKEPQEIWKIIFPWKDRAFLEISCILVD